MFFHVAFKFFIARNKYPHPFSTALLSPSYHGSTYIVTPAVHCDLPTNRDTLAAQLSSAVYARNAHSKCAKPQGYLYLPIPYLYIYKRATRHVAGARRAIDADPRAHQPSIFGREAATTGDLYSRAHPRERRHFGGQLCSLLFPSSRPSRAWAFDNARLVLVWRDTCLMTRLGSLFYRRSYEKCKAKVYRALPNFIKREPNFLLECLFFDL